MIRRLQDLDTPIKDGKSLILLGPRGVGKTSLVKEQLKNHKNVLSFNLLKGEEYRMFAGQTEIFRKEVEYQINQKEKLIVFVDEVQRIPDLLNEVHFLIEEYKNKVQFILTGSSARKLRRQEANLLAGRAINLKLHPISVFESDAPLEQLLQFGQLPVALHSNDSSYLETYVDIYLREEIYQESLIRKQEVFSRFLDVAAQYSGEPIAYTKIAKLSATSDNTVKEYFQILVDTLLVHRIDGWSHSTIKQLNKQPRFYFFDLGVLNAAKGEVSSKVKLSSGRGGKLFEHLVILELIRLNDYYNKRYKFFHYRERENAEIDLILQRNLNEPPIAIEIKVDGTPEPSELRTLEKFKELEKKAKCLCFTAGNSSYQQGPVIICPWKEGIKKLFS